MRYRGYTGTVLNVDLTNRGVKEEPLTDEMAENYIGGVGLATRIIADEAHNWKDPLDEGNPLLIMNGPVTGSIIPWSGRHCVAGISPLTGMFGEAYAGGTFARELKRAGYDGILITGRADSLVYLQVSDDRVTIEDAGDLTGLDTYVIEEVLREKCGNRTKVAAIGGAGEGLVKLACVMNDGPAGRAAARCGMGALMGSKNLKAIAVNGTGEVRLADREGLIKTIRNTVPKMLNDPLRRLKKAQFIYSFFIDDGRNSVHNWRDGELPGFKEAVLKETEKHVHEHKSYNCAGCPSSCVESYIGFSGRLLHWESFSPLGSQCGLKDMDYVQKAFDICNRQGVDCISAGGVLSFAMECYEEGLIGPEDTDGIDLRFGNGDAMLAMLEKVCKREGFGDVLAEGVRGAARRIGKDAEKYAIETKGLEYPAHDPRAHNFLALTYATGNRGASHCEAGEPRLENEALENPRKFQFAVEGMAEKVLRGQNYVCFLNSMIMCAFSNDASAQSNAPEGFSGLNANMLVDWFNLATGMDRTLESFLKAGERIFNLKHLINLKCGYDVSSDRLHERFTTVKRQPGSLADHLPQIKSMLEDYYLARNWSRDGKVKPEKLKELNLDPL